MTDPLRRQPIFNIPAVVLVTILAMAGIQALQSWVAADTDADWLARFAFVPGRLTLAFDPDAVAGRLAAMTAADPDPEGAAAVARFFLGDGSAQPWTVLTYAVLHGGWTHLGLNSIWLLAFGAPLARRLAPVRFLALLIASAIAGAAAHWAVDPLSLQPLVGASAAVSGCMGAALRFLFGGDLPVEDDRPDARYRGPRRPLSALFADRRATAFLGVWLLSNFVTGVAAIPLGLSDMPIAWQAHVGGFVLGLLAFPLFDPLPPAPPPEPPAALAEGG